jgi:peroxiredoxin family protein
MAPKLNIICISGLRENLQMAAMLAATAAVSGSDVSVFLSMNSLQFFVKTNHRSAPSEGEIGLLMEKRHVPPFVDLFRQAAELGDAKLYPCSMAMEVLGIPDGELQPYIEKPLGLTKYLSEFDDGHVMTF